MIERTKIASLEHWHAMRSQDVTASVAAALVGAHPFETAYGLFAAKTGQISNSGEESAPMRRGRLLESVAIKVLEEDYPHWLIGANPAPGGFYFRDPDRRMGATPDVIVTCPERGIGVVQIKSVEAGLFRKNWNVDGEITPPLYAVIQAIIEAHLVGAKWAAVAALVVGHGVDLHLIEAPLHEGILTRIRDEVAKFWARVEANDPPDPDYGRDGALLARLMVQDNGQAMDLSGDNMLPALLAERCEIKARIKVDEDRCAEIDAEIRDKVGEAQIATLPGWKVSLKTQHTKEYTVKARTTRPIRITQIGEAS